MAKQIKKVHKEELRHDPVRDAILSIIAFFKKISKLKYFWYGLYGLGGVVAVVIAVILYKNATKPRMSTEADFVLLQAIVSITQQDTTKAPQLLQALTTKYRTTTAGQRAYYYSGLYYQKMGDNQKALGYYRKFLGSSIEDKLLRTFTYANLSDIYVDIKNFGKALNYIQKAEKSAPTEPLKAYYYYKLARIYYLKGDIKKSRETLETFSKKFPKSSLTQTVNEELQFLKGMLGEVN